MTNKLRPPLAVIFDTDNTLYPYDYPNKIAMRAVIAKATSLIGVSKKEFQDAFVHARREIKERLGTTASSHSRLLYLQRTIELLGSQTRLLLTLDLEQTYWRTFLAHCEIFPGLVETLQLLREMRVQTAIITDLTAQIQFRKIIYFDLEKYFDYVVTSEEAGADKPSSVPYSLAVEKINVEPSAIWMIGDNSISDIAGARNVGMTAVQKIHSGVKRDVGPGKPDLAFRTYFDLIKIFRNYLK